MLIVLLVPSEIGAFDDVCADWPRLTVLLVPSDIDGDVPPAVFAVIVLLVPSAIAGPDEDRRCGARQTSGPVATCRTMPDGQDGVPESCWATHCTTSERLAGVTTAGDAAAGRRGSGAVTKLKPVGHPRKISVVAARAGTANGA